MPARKFTAKGPRLYDRFLTGTCEWAEMLAEADLAEIYPEGYLPYSGDASDSRHLFYRARSLRVDTGSFSLNKGRRYDHRKWQSHALERRLMPKEAFLEQLGDRVVKLAYQWMEPRFGDHSLARDRLLYILEKPFLRDLLTWWNGPELWAFALMVHGPWGAHYWYVFYKNGGHEPAAPGHGYLIDFIEWCAGKGLPYAYLGTTYGNKSRYKSRGVRGISFWDGIKWNGDRTRLAELRVEDDTEA